MTLGRTAGPHGIQVYRAVSTQSLQGWVLWLSTTPSPPPIPHHSDLRNKRQGLRRRNSGQQRQDPAPYWSQGEDPEGGLEDSGTRVVRPQALGRQRKGSQGEDPMWDYTGPLALIEGAPLCPVPAMSTQKPHGRAVGLGCFCTSARGVTRELRALA